MIIPVRLLLMGTVLATSSITGRYAPPAEGREIFSINYSDTIFLPGLYDSVSVYRDERGMPHIYAENEHDLYLVTGYVTAQERLWQMDLIRRSASGELSEIFGKSFLQADIFARCLQIGKKSKRIIREEDPLILSCLQAFTDGVNDFINACGTHLPPEFRILSYKPDPWTLEDIASIIGLMGWNLDCRNLTAELFVHELIRKVGIEKAAGLIPDWKSTDALVYPDFDISDISIAAIKELVSSFAALSNLGVSAFSASNNWAVSGSRSKTGMPLLSNDMHLNLSSPGLWMQMHQVIPGKLNVTGVVIPGEPFIIAGHNASIAWGMTNFRVDAVDLFAERINPDNPDLYLLNGEWKEVSKSREVIELKGGRRDTVTIRFTHRGPIISGCLDTDQLSTKLRWLGYDYLYGLHGNERSALSLRWSGFDDSDEVGAVWNINKAEGWNDFREGVSLFRSISQNFIYADTLGNIGLSSGGGIPVRTGSGILIRDGGTDEFDWKGYVPFEQLPYEFNPASGYVSSANNRSTGDDYPWFISNSFEMPYRINRIREMIEAKDKLGTDDFTIMMMDQHSDLARMMKPALLGLREKTAFLTPTAIAMLDSLEAWDCDMDPSEIAPSLLEYFRISFKRNLLADELGDLYDRMWDIAAEYYIYRILKEGPDGWVDDITTEKVETLDDIILKSFNDAIGALEKEYGRNPEHWKWGRIHTVTFMHPLGSVRILGSLLGLNSKKYPVGGSDHTVCPYFTYKPGFDAVYGASVRLILNTADWDESLSVLPGGISGVPGSEFYLSQADAFIGGRFYKDHYSREAVLAAAKYTLILIPASP